MNEDEPDSLEGLGDVPERGIYGPSRNEANQLNHPPVPAPEGRLKRLVRSRAGKLFSLALGGASALIGSSTEAAAQVPPTPESEYVRTAIQRDPLESLEAVLGQEESTGIEPGLNFREPMPFPTQLDKDTEALFGPYMNTRISQELSQEELDKLTSLPTFKGREVLPDGTIVYKFTSAYFISDNEVRISGGKVVFKAVTTLKLKGKGGPVETPRISSYTEQLGAPERVIKGSAIDDNLETYLYPSKGVAMIVNPGTNEVLQIQTYKPITVEEYLQTWGQNIQYLNGSPAPNGY